MAPGGTILVHGTQISLDSSAYFFVVDGGKSSITMVVRPAAPVLTIVIDSSTIKAVIGQLYAINGQLLTPGGTITTQINGKEVTHLLVPLLHHSPLLEVVHSRLRFRSWSSKQANLPLPEVRSPPLVSRISSGPRTTSTQVTLNIDVTKSSISPVGLTTSTSSKKNAAMGPQKSLLFEVLLFEVAASLALARLRTFSR